jgi:dihydroorotase
MGKSYDVVLKGGTVVNQDGVGVRDVAVRDGRIAAVGTIDPGLAGEAIDCHGLTVLPGVIDTHVHFREPGLTHKEDLESGSRAAVLGGVTAVFEMPNTNPTTTTAVALEDKVARAAGRMHCDFAFYVGATRENTRDLAELERLPGCCGVKVFMGSSTGSLLVEDDDGVRAILNTISRCAAFHSEDEYRLRERIAFRVDGDPASHPVWRDAEAALRCTQRLVALARETGKRVHVLHVSTADEIDFLAGHKDVATAEATPSHLTLVAPDCYRRLGTRAQLNPHVRDEFHRAGIWRGVAQGVIDTLGSDHSPHTLAEKAHPYPKSHSGMTGVQTLVPVMLDHVVAGRLSIERFVDLTSAGPARVFGLARKGRLAVGYDADLTVVDLARRETITNAWIASKAAWTPYDGVEVCGWPVGTFVRGAKVMWEGELVTPAQGAAVRFGETLSAAV